MCSVLVNFLVWKDIVTARFYSLSMSKMFYTLSCVCMKLPNTTPYLNRTLLHDRATLNWYLPDALNKLSKCSKGMMHLFTWINYRMLLTSSRTWSNIASVKERNPLLGALSLPSKSDRVKSQLTILTFLLGTEHILPKITKSNLSNNPRETSF